MSKVMPFGGSFQGQAVFVGIDVHARSWLVTVRSLGMQMHRFSMSPSSKKLVEYLHKRYPGGTYYSVYEAGFSGFWIHRELVACGVNNIVVHAADVPTTHKEKLTKTDKVDSGKLARCLENGELQPLYVPELSDQQLRSLSRLRRSCTQDITRVKNRIKGHLYYYGITLTDAHTAHRWSGVFIAELDKLSHVDNPAASCLRICLQELKQRRNQLLQITRELRALCRDGSDAVTFRCLLSVPGVGPVTAMTFIAEIIDINRFRSADHLCAFVGLVPTCDSSGERERVGRLTPRKNAHLKHLIIEAAWSAVRRDPDLARTFAALSCRMRKTQAIIRIARKLLNRIRHVWKNQTLYIVDQQLPC